MKLPKVVLSSALFWLVLSGCSNDASDDREPSRNAPNLSAVKLTPFNELGRFNGVPPSDLMKDAIIGKEIRAIVPRTAFACMDNVFNYMHDLELGKDGALSATMNGSHADNFMEASVTVKPSGGLIIVLQCVTEVEQMSSPKRYQIFTNENIHSINPSAVQGIYDPNKGDIVLVSDGKEKIEAPFETFEQAQVPTDVTRQVVKTSGAQGNPTSSVTGSPLLGDWACQSRKSNGASFSSAFRFSRDGGFVYTDPQSEMIGTYQANGTSVRVVMDQITVGGRVMSSKMKVGIDLTSSGAGHVKFDMTLLSSGVVTSNNCVSGAVAEATPAPQVNVCDVNPDACAAIQRNNDIRSQLRNQRCEALRGMASDYELAKVGCL